MSILLPTQYKFHFKRKQPAHFLRVLSLVSSSSTGNNRTPTNPSINFYLYLLGTTNPASLSLLQNPCVPILYSFLNLESSQNFSNCKNR